MLIGIDLVRISQVAASLERFGDRFIRRVFTDGEIAYCASSPPLAAQRFAARFAAKEATVKVLRPRRLWARWRDIEVRRDGTGWCDIVLHDHAAELAREAGLGALALSLSHDSDVAAAVVVALPAGAPPAGLRDR
ncbi:MAG: holo-ACP synthase [Gemmatimonadaceae bacterium]